MLPRFLHLSVLAALVALLFAPRAARAEASEATTVVVAVGATSDVAWSLAQAVYRSAARPVIAEADARALAGEAPSAAGGQATALAQLRQAATGNDAPSRALFARILRDTGARQLAFVLREESGGVVARIYRADDTVDEESYFPSGDPKEPHSWNAVVAALFKRKGPPLVTERGRAPSDEAQPARPFYASPWFWGGIAAAALTGGAIYLATRDGSSGPIHLQVRMP